MSARVFVIILIVLVLCYAFYGFVGFVKLENYYPMQNRSRIVVSLTTLPSRVNLLHRVVASILGGTVKPDKIYINIPPKSNRENTTYSIPDSLKAYVNFCEADNGPITKLYPTLLSETDPETIIVSIDDDMEYDPRLIEHLLLFANQYTDKVVCVSGWNYINFFNMVAIPVKLPIPNVAKKVEILQCYNGVLYKRKFFTDIGLFERMMAAKQYSTVDDIIISMYLKKKNVDIISVPGFIRNKNIELENEGDFKLGKFNLRNNVWIKSLNHFKKEFY